MPPSPLNVKWTANKPKSTKARDEAASGDVVHLSAYEEAQHEEVLALRAIFMDDYVEVEARNAWSRNSQRCFKLRLRASSDAAISLNLGVTLTLTYPKSVPLLHLEDISGLRQKYLEQVQNTVRTLPLKLVGEVMINEIAVHVQDVLEDAAISQAQDNLLPSLEQERAESEAAATRLANEKEAEQRRQLEQERAEEDRIMQRMVDREIQRRQETRRRQEVESADELLETLSIRDSTTTVTFDQPICVLSLDAADVIFKSITILAQVHTGKSCNVFLVSPSLKVTSSLCLVLKRFQLHDCKRKDMILRLENELEKLKRLQNPHAVNIFDFKIDNQDMDWNIDVLMEHASHGSLRDFLQFAGGLSAHRARPLAIDVLQAVEFYHKNGIVHGRLHCGNILLMGLSNGSTVLKLADAAIQQTLHDLTDGTKDRIRPLKDNSSWTAPELFMSSESNKTRKTDIWEFGVVFLEMLFGLEVTRKFTSPQAFMNGSSISMPLEDMMREVLRSDPKRRPSAFDIIPYEFLRTDAPTTSREETPSNLEGILTTDNESTSRVLAKRTSQQASSSASRYSAEWIEVGRLGRGGYGEVVKARNKLDGRLYAIKKITNKSPAELSQVLSEVHLLATLNHPFVVRYFSAWPEDEVSSADDQSHGFSSSSEFKVSNAQTSFAFGESTGGLDLMSSSGYPRIEFGEDDEDEDEEEVDDDDDTGEEKVPMTQSDDDYDSIARENNNRGDPNVVFGTAMTTSSCSDNAVLEIQRSRSTSRMVVKTTLFIQMEYCERLTLRDMIRRGINEAPGDVWRLLRQILEGLVHIHSHGIIHRDLKPENIFIDIGDTPKIGDFGLATTGQYSLVDSTDHTRTAGGEMTRSIGTTLYVAPELRSNVTGHYTDKVDMYSLGIILFEMCYPLKTAMERYHMISSLRDRNHSLPDSFSAPDKQLQSEVILSLVRHRPSERLGSKELLRSGKLPTLVEDETIQLALNGLSDQNSPYYHKMLSALFSQGDARQLRDQMWEMSGEQASGRGAGEYALTQGVVKDRMVACFRRHGAVAYDRQIPFPRSDYYTSSNVVQLLDASGALVQLPYDLTLPHARAIAREGSVPQRTYTFGTVFREAASGYAPRGGHEADFDLVSYDVVDNALREAEVIKVMDEILDEFPSINSAQMCYHLNHASLIDIILDFCRIDLQQRPAAKAILGKLNVQSWTWVKIRTELRAPTIGISSTSLDELARFDFRDNLSKCHSRLRALLPNEHLSQVDDIFHQLSELNENLRHMGVKRPCYWCPLSSFNEPFYKNAIMFQCLFDGKKRDILAAGGRYDSLVEAHKPKYTNGGPVSTAKIHAVGINIVWDRLISSMLRFQKQGDKIPLRRGDETEKTQWMTRRCDCLVASFDAKTLRTVGLKILSQLWSNDISAELAIETRLPEELLSHYRDERHSWIIIVKHDANVAKPDIKVKNMDKHEDSDLRSSELVSYLRSEMRDRDQRHGSLERAKLHRQPSVPETMQRDRMGPVTVLQTSSKRKNRVQKWHAVETAQARAGDLAHSLVEGAPIASIEVRDEVLNMIRETRLSDPESWRKVIHTVPLAEREYVQQIYDLLLKFKHQHSSATRNSFVYSFKTGLCIYYDLLL